MDLNGTIFLQPLDLTIATWWAEVRAHYIGQVIDKKALRRDYNSWVTRRVKQHQCEAQRPSGKQFFAIVQHAARELAEGEADSDGAIG